MQTAKVTNIKGSPNQFELDFGDTIAFQSYKTLIAIKRHGKVTLDKTAWNYSKTTAKYRNIFLNATTPEVVARIKSGEYALADLN